MEVHRELGKGFSEVVYKEAMQVEFRNSSIVFEREKQCLISYKGQLLEHHYFADFILFGKILLEVKAVDQLTNAHVRQVLNYLASAKLRLGLLVNFGEDSLAWKRIVL
jgi:GxxExxY protein